jgi:hypothetical protein
MTTRTLVAVAPRGERYVRFARLAIEAGLRVETVACAGSTLLVRVPAEDAPALRALLAVVARGGAS